MNSNNPKPLSVPDMARMFGLSESAVRRLLAREEIPGRKVGRRWFSTAEAIARWLDTKDGGDVR